MYHFTFLHLHNKRCLLLLVFVCFHFVSNEQQHQSIPTWETGPTCKDSTHLGSWRQGLGGIFRFRPPPHLVWVVFGEPTPQLWVGGISPSWQQTTEDEAGGEEEGWALGPWEMLEIWGSGRLGPSFGKGEAKREWLRELPWQELWVRGG